MLWQKHFHFPKVICCFQVQLCVCVCVCVCVVYLSAPFLRAEKGTIFFNSKVGNICRILFWLVVVYDSEHR